MKEQTKFKGQSLGILKIENYLIFFLSTINQEKKITELGPIFIIEQNLNIYEPLECSNDVCAH